MLKIAEIPAMCTVSGMDTLQQYLDDLDPDQRAAVTAANDRSALVIAGPGSGKTRVLTGRAAYVVDEFDVDPTHVFAVTFTNKAAQEVATRARKLSPATSRVFVGTFHRLCISVLMRARGRGPVPENFSIADASDARSVIYDVLGDVDISWARNRATAAREVASVFTNAKNRMIRPSACGSSDAHILAEAKFDRYNEVLAERDLLDFDDVLVRMYDLLKAGCADKLLDRAQHLLVDEFQDTSMVQYLIARQFVDAGTRLFAVGDPHQSIYTFRGADGSVMARTPEDIPNLDTHIVGFNYRSTPEIVDFAKQVIAVDPVKAASPMSTVRDTGVDVAFVEAKGPTHEARLLAERVSSSEVPYNGHVVLVRSMYAASAVERALQEESIPYRMIRGSAMYDRAEVKDLLSWLKVLVNPADQVSWKRAASSAKCRVGDAALSAVYAAAAEAGQTTLEFLLTSDNLFPSRYASALRTFSQKVRSVSEHENAADAVAAVREILGVSGWSGEDRENVDQVYALASERQRTVEEFVSETSQFTEAASADGTAQAVDITTVHSSKGLEYPVVHVIGCDEGSFPSWRSLDDPAQVTDERRLFYVAATRAESQLYISWPGRRMKRGVYTTFAQATDDDFVDTRPSQFIPKAAMKNFTSHVRRDDRARPKPRTGRSPSRPWANPSVQIKTAHQNRTRAPGAGIVASDVRKRRELTAAARSAFKVGDRVLSEAFGNGIVKSVEASSRSVRVSFGGAQRSVRADELVSR